jgi:hypothetical protein
MAENLVQGNKGGMRPNRSFPQPEQHLAFWGRVYQTIDTTSQGKQAGEKDNGNDRRDHGHHPFGGIWKMDFAVSDN